MQVNVKNLRSMLKKPALKKAMKKVSDIASVIKDDAVVGANYGKLKLKELDAERKKAAKTYAIGRRALVLCNNGKIRDKAIVKLSKSIETLDRIAKRYSNAAKTVARKIRFKKKKRR